MCIDWIINIHIYKQKYNLHKAIMMRNVNYCKYLLAMHVMKNVELKYYGSTYLMLTSVHNNEKLVRVLIKIGANLENTNNTEETALMLAVYSKH